MPTRQNDNSIQSRIKRSRAIDKKINILDRRVDELYKDIYVSRTDNIHNIDTIIDDIDNTIDKIQGMDSSASSMSELLRRVDQKETGNTEAMLNSVSELFSNDNLLSSVFMNDDVHRFISAQNYNYDLICKYLPRLNDALEILRDNVLCSDNFDKKFLNPREPNLSKDAIALFKANADKLDDKYELSEFLDDTYMKTSKYGEDFIYIVPYPIAFKRMFEREKKIGSFVGTQQSLFEGYNEVKLLQEDYGTSKEFLSYAKDVEHLLESNIDSVLKSMPELGEINIFFNNTGMVNSAVHEYAILKEKEALPIMESLSSLYESAGSLNSTNMTGVFKDAINSKGRRNKVLSGLNNDGLVLDKNLDRDPEKIDQDMLGAVLERLPREDVIPVYMGKKCLGYYYFEFAEDKTACGYCGGHHLTPGLGNAARYHYDSNMDHQELVARYVSSRISRVIDSKFINANKDLKEEIYAILRYNERFDITRKNNIGVTFIPAEDIIHCYFKMNEKTHRGISDLENSLIPAMLYILLYLTDIIGRITRSTDKRVYYVKQNVETNVARTMMNVVAQIKKGNMGMRQIESMNNILNIVGKYNDYIIPVGPSGDSPIQFDIMQGQEINTPTDMMEKMEEAAVNPIMPYEMVNGTYQQDFAVHYTMSNTRLLRRVFTRQRKTEFFYSKIYTKTYNFEYGENYSKIDVILPPPLFLIMQNNSQLFDNIDQMSEKIANMEINGNEEDDDKLKLEFKKQYIRSNLSTYIDWGLVDRIIEGAKVSIEANKKPATEDGDDESPEAMMSDEL